MSTRTTPSKMWGSAWGRPCTRPWATSRASRGWALHGSPLDEALSEAVVDLSGRAYLVYEDDLLPAMIAGEEKDVWREFFKSLAFKGQMNLHVRMLYGKNGHHLLESAFKALGQALRQAVSIQRIGTPSTKGSLG